MEKLKREKARAKGAYTRSRTKLLMIMQSEEATRTEVIERLDCFAEAFEKAIMSLDSLGQLCEQHGDSGKIGAISNEWDAIESDFNETEQTVKRYLEKNKATTSKLEPSIAQQTRDLEQEVSQWAQEFSNLIQEYEEWTMPTKDQWTCRL